MNPVIFAFPGMGKTPLARDGTNFIDLDFGHFREAHKVLKREEAKLYPIFVNLIEKYRDEGWVVLTNEPGLIPLLKERNVPMKMYYPYNITRSAKKLGATGDQVVKWIHDWVRVAKEYNVPATQIHVGLDHYLRR